MDDTTAPRGRTRLAWAVAIVTFALAAATVLLYVLDPSAVGANNVDATNGATSWGTGGLSGFFVFLLPFLAFAGGRGYLVATRRPGNKSGGSCWPPDPSGS